MHVLELIGVNKDLIGSFCHENNQKIKIQKRSSYSSSTRSLPFIIQNTMLSCINSHDTNAYDSYFASSNYAKFSGLIEVPTTKVTTIGRSSRCDIIVNHPAISVEHIKLWTVKFDSDVDSIVYLKDDSLNGVIINGRRTKYNEIVVLFDNDEIELRRGIYFRYRDFFKSKKCSLATALSFPTHIKDWIITDKILGYGSFGTVLIAKKKNANPSYSAVKVFNIGRQGMRSHERNSKLQHEAEILKKIQHPHIINIQEVLEDNNRLFFFEDLLCGGDLFSYLSKGHSLHAIPERESLFIVYQILLGLRFIHDELNIIHRDLKLDNILLVEPRPYSKIIICDFGIAKCLGPGMRASTFVGTIEYTAPEVLLDCLLSSNLDMSNIERENGSEGYDHKCDMWSVGIICHIMLSGISPFYHRIEKDIITSARLGKLNFSLQQWTCVTNPAKDFLNTLIQVNPKNRHDSTNALKHKWIESNQKILTYYYNKVITDR